MNPRSGGAIVVLAVGLVATSATDASPASSPASTCLAHAPEAAARSGLPRNIIVRVMTAESGGDSHAVSSRGAMGCMQIMPGTWRYLATRYNLGSDPLEVRMNMIGGALYLAELIARFGLPGAYSAYNAGPGRYRQFVDNGVPLPAETIAYTARITGITAARIPVAPQTRWQESGLFVPRPNGHAAAKPAITTANAEPAPTATEDAPVPTLFPLPNARARGSITRSPALSGRDSPDASVRRRDDRRASF